MGLVRFSVYEFDPAAPELRRNGRRVHLQEMPLRVLEMLLERPNELVSREVFFARLWPHDHTGILDDNLNTAVRKLRLALNDSAHHPRFIETVPKRGYRFVGASDRVSEAEAPPIAPAVAQNIEPGIELSTGTEAGPITDPGAVNALALADSTPRPSRRPYIAIASLLILVGGAATFAFYRSDDRAAPSASAALTMPTVAVLPFVNADGRAEDEYFSDGLTEEVIDRLARLEALRVVSRTSAFSLKHKELSAREIGEMLGAGSLVEGSVRRSGDLLRVSARLINAQDGYQLWAQTFDRRVDDVMAIQEDIAVAIADTLTGRLLGGKEAAQDSRLRPADAAAYDSYLKGRFNWHRRSGESLRAAVKHFDDSIARAPDYAPAWAGLADAYAVLGFYDFLKPTDAFPKAQDAARRALELDPRNASAEATLGYVSLYYCWDFGAAEAHFKRSIELDPGATKAHQWYGNLLTAAGRFDEAEREMRRAQQLEPLSLIATAALGWSMYYAGKHEAALEVYRTTLDLDRDFQLAYLWSGWALEALGRYDEALAMLTEAAERSSGSGIALASLARVRALRGERDEARRLLEALTHSDSYVPAYEISKAWFALGAQDEAGAWLQRARDERSHSLVFVRVDPQLAAVQKDPRVLRVATLGN